MTNIINYFSSAAIGFLFFKLKEKVKVFDVFLDGSKEGIEIVFKLFPTLIFLAIGALRSSGFIDLVVNLITPFTNLLEMPSEIAPLAILRPISGSASME